MEQGWLAGAGRVPSAHYACRPGDETPTLLLVHNIG
ncbi:1,6-anhydro-N-acetylmuramyl-L-alanine amidase AmpD, partial [Escherichia coli]|nr:1,6-anhydro-N-acetylmuramyl-L-alanine amidase AmpD [Escherichia coli]